MGCGGGSAAAAAAAAASSADRKADSAAAVRRSTVCSNASCTLMLPGVSCTPAAETNFKLFYCCKGTVGM